MNTPGPNAQNPYAPPTARVQDVGDSSGPGELAERSTRFGAFLLDALLLGIVETPALFATIRVAIAAAQNGHPMTDPLQIYRVLLMGNAGLPYTGALFLIWAAITIIFVARHGQSIGKRIVGIKVVRTDGSKASFWRIFLLRNLVNGIPSLLAAGLQIPLLNYAYFLLDSLLIFGDSRQCLHDKIASTVVVKA
jgi:uncharacterized RDD family membrane protein YckC